MLNRHGKNIGIAGALKSRERKKRFFALLGSGIQNNVLSICFKALIITVALSLGVPIAIGLLTLLPSVPGVEIKELFRTFNYFTFYSCAGGSVYYGFDIIYLLSHKKHTEKRADLFASLKGLVTVSAAVTMIVFALYVDKSFFTLFTGAVHGETHGLDVCLNALHFAVPILMILDWLLFDEKGLVNKSVPVISGVTSVIYTLYVMAASLFFGGSGINTKYLYRFYDADKLGVGTVVFMALLVIGIVVGLSFLLLYADRALARAAEKEKTKCHAIFT